MREQSQVWWEGDSKDVLSSFPSEVRSTLGYSLRLLQNGKLPACSVRSMSSVGDGVWEMKTDDEKTWYRVLYLARINNVIYVLHCFEKDSRKTDRRDIETARKRLKDVQQRVRDQKKEGEKAMTKPRHITRGDVLDDLGFSRSEAASLKVKADLLDAILDEVRRRGHSQRDLVDILDEYQPNVSNLLQGKIAKVSIEKLLAYSERLGLCPSVSVKRSPRRSFSQHTAAKSPLQACR